ncbi:hypothetical protein ACFTAO_27530 [Paenibacillus rhizoplanae]
MAAGSMISQIELVLNELPESEKKVAEYILANAKEVMHMSIHELAAKAVASSAAVVRFFAGPWASRASPRLKSAYPLK